MSRSRVGVVVTVKASRHGLNSRRAQLQQEILRPRNSAENHRASRNIRRRDAPAYPPYQFAIQGEQLGRSTAGQHNRVGAGQGSKRFAQAPCRKQAVSCVFGCNQYDVEITCQGTMLKAVIQQVKLLPEACFLRIGAAS